MAMHRRSWLILSACLLAALLVGACAPAAPRPATPAAPIDWAQLEAAARARGSLPVIIGLDVPGQPREAIAGDAQAAARQQAAFAQAQDKLLRRLDGHQVHSIRRFDFIPFIAMSVDAAALAALRADPAVVSVEEDTAVAPELAQTIPLIRADFAHIAAYTGAGQAVAILDTGVDRFHPSLSGRVVAGACYSTSNPAEGYSSLCPGGASSATTIASGQSCAGASGCDHGTHVAGIAARVAPGAGIIAIQVFTRFTDSPGNTRCADVGRTSPCTLSRASDQILALQRVFALRNTYAIAAVNMSLGGGQFFSSCDATETGRKAAIDSLRNAGIATVIAAGNSSFTNSAATPGCISSAISVAATDNSDQVASFSNLAPYTTLFAPGVDIYAPVPGGGFDDKGGTSMAAPHVAGTVALLKQARPSLTVAQLTSALAGSGPFVSDQRVGGSIGKRRLHAYEALCQVIGCDADDFRVIQYGQTFSGAITPGGDVDHFYFLGQAGDRLTLRANRSSGSLDPYVELLDRTGARVAVNNNGGGGVNALINGYTLLRNELYVVRVLTAPGTSTTGGYQLTASREIVPLNPVPQIGRLSPSSATATPFGSDFWVAIHGSGFMQGSTVRWNGALRSASFSSSSLIYIRVLGSDIGPLPLPPRTALITVHNPAPGGGTSAPHPFTISVPFLGESELVAPAAGSSVAAGLKQTFVISWTHPTDSWRTMQRMDLRLRDPESGAVAAVVRVIERAGETSTMRLLSGADAVSDDSATVAPIEGLPGEARDLSLPGAATLHLAESAFSGSGRTAIMTPTLTFDPAVVGSYTIEFEVDSPDGAIQADDVLGTFSVLPLGCTVAVNELSLSGPSVATVGGGASFSANVTPPAATAPISYTWSPEPTGGQGTPNASYGWDTAGDYVVAVQAENCGGFAAGAQSVAVSSGPAPDLAIALAAPDLALAGEPVTYTLRVANDGAASVSNLRISATIPAGASYQGGGARSGDTVSWAVPALDGAGATVEMSYTVTAQSSLIARGYSASADGGHSASAGPAVATLVVDALAAVTPSAPATISHGAGATRISIDLPAGAVFADTAVGYSALAAPSRPLPPGATFLGRAFSLTAFQAGAPAGGLRFGDTVTISLSYSVAPAAGRVGLAYWDGAGWSEQGVSCTPGGVAQELICTASNPPAGELALLAQPWRSYLPQLVR